MYTYLFPLQHFVGNQALILADGETEMQIAYSSGITVLSFCMPVLVLLGAFYAIGITNRIAWWRVVTAGMLCGSAICGMHYLGNASIQNYQCIYDKAYVVGAATIAVVASTAALAMFFIFQSLSASSWWKRTISALVLAGAVSSMHWCASVGTEYRLLQLGKREGRSRTATVIAVICLVSVCYQDATSSTCRPTNSDSLSVRVSSLPDQLSFEPALSSKQPFVPSRLH